MVNKMHARNQKSKESKLLAGHMIIPRSNSTSDLFEVPMSKNIKNSTHISKRRKSTLQTSMGPPNAYPSPNSFDSDISPVSMNDLYCGDQFKQYQYQAPHRKLTPYQIQRQKMRRSFRFPNGENFTPRKQGIMTPPETQHRPRSTSLGNVKPIKVVRSRSMSSIPQAKFNTHDTQYADHRHSLTNTNHSIYLQSQAYSKTSTDTENCMKDSLNGDTQSENTMMSDSGINETHDEYDVLTKPVIITNDSFNDKIPNSKKVNLNSSVKTLTKDTKEIKKDTKKTLVKKNSTAISKSNVKTNPVDIKPTPSPPTRNDSIKRQHAGLGIGSFFKRLIGNSSPKADRKRRKIEATVSKVEKVEDVCEEITMDDLSLTLEIDKDSQTELMDTDLIFDSLLFEMNNPKSINPTKLKRQRQIETLKIEEQLEAEIEVGETILDPNFIDYNIVNDFAKLGDFINLSISDDVTKTPPPRSRKRPALKNKEIASSFYNSQDDIFKRLHEQWRIVLIDEVPPASSNTNNLKTVRFAKEVYLGNTFSATEYVRKDQKFRERMMMLMQGDTDFFEKVKIELNDYKRNEMVINEAMTNYTQYFE